MGRSNGRLVGTISGRQGTFVKGMPPACRPPAPACRRPGVVLQIKNYSLPTAAEGRQRARSDIPFLFKAFETGQAPPPRPGTKKAEAPRAATIHEYLDWTVTASEAEDPDELVGGCDAVGVGVMRWVRWCWERWW